MLAVDPDGHVTPKLLDFGIAKVPVGGVHTLEGGVLGTPRYMSPEQIRSDAKIDGRSDLFTVGVLLYEMLTGASPFEAGSASASLAAVLETQVDPDPAIDPRVWLVIQRALAKRPYERFATAGELAQSLRAAIPETDKELATTLQRAKPSPRSTTLEIDTPAIDARPFTEDVAALEVTSPVVPKQALRRIVAVTVLLSIVAVLGAATILRRSSTAAAAASEKLDTPTTTAPAMPSGVTIVATEPSAAFEIPASTSVVRAASTVPRRSAPAITGARKNPRGVATTPGF
jgi:serine/threonine-protein kinase